MRATILLCLLMLCASAAGATDHAMELTMGPDLIAAANNTQSTERVSSTIGVGIKAGSSMAIGLEMESNPAAEISAAVAVRAFARLSAGPMSSLGGALPFLQVSLGEALLPTSGEVVPEGTWRWTVTPRLGAEIPVADRWSTYALGSLTLESDGGVVNSDAGASFGVLVKLGHRRKV